ncbi:unnamed protein product [Closterium sp. Naga37s-1]|nr:unnamed protein product [Closterium sp. Naga37s-1]
MSSSPVFHLGPLKIKPRPSSLPSDLSIPPPTNSTLLGLVKSHDRAMTRSSSGSRGVLPSAPSLASPCTPSALPSLFHMFIPIPSIHRHSIHLIVPRPSSHHAMPLPTSPHARAECLPPTRILRLCPPSPSPLLPHHLTTPLPSPPLRLQPTIRQRAAASQARRRLLARLDAQLQHFTVGWGGVGCRGAEWGGAGHGGVGWGRMGSGGQ